MAKNVCVTVPRKIGSETCCWQESMLVDSALGLYLIGGPRGWGRGSRRSPGKSKVAIGFLRNTDSTPQEAIGPLQGRRQ